MVMFYIELPVDGRLRRICIQFVKRGNTIYARRCAYTFWQPTPAQREVRDALRKYAVQSYGQPLAVLDAQVAAGFRDWVKVPAKIDKLRQALMKAYPRDTTAVEAYMANPEVT